MKALGQFASHERAHNFGIHRLGQNLHGKNVVVAVDDEAGEEVGFAEDHAVGIGVLDDRRPIRDGIGDALTKQRPKVGNQLARDQAEGNLRRARIERAAEDLPAMIRYRDQRAGPHSVGRNDVGAVNPDMAIFQARRAAS